MACPEDYRPASSHNHMSEVFKNYIYIDICMYTYHTYTHTHTHTHWPNTLHMFLYIYLLAKYSLWWTICSVLFFFLMGCFLVIDLWKFFLLLLVFWILNSWVWKLYFIFFSSLVFSSVPLIQGKTRKEAFFGSLLCLLLPRTFLLRIPLCSFFKLRTISFLSMILFIYLWVCWVLVAAFL